MNDIYTQCRLTKGDFEQVTWIPYDFARPGRIIKLKTTDGWDNGWLVKDIFGSATRYVLLGQEKTIKAFKEVLEGN